MDMVFTQNHTITDIHVDAFGRVKPSVLLHFAQEAAGGHCQLLQLDWDTLAQKDLFWAIIRQRVQVTRLPMRGETITVETWPMPTTRTAYPRATIGYDAEGNELFRVMGLWVLMNLWSTVDLRWCFLRLTVFQILWRSCLTFPVCKAEDLPCPPCLSILLPSLRIPCL